MKKLFIFLTAFILLANIFLLGTSKHVSATEQGDVVTKVYITDKDGNELTGDLSQWQIFRINVDFTLPDNVVSEGDTTTIKIPDAITFTDTAAFDVKDANGNKVFTATVDPTTKSIVLTYTKYVETHSGVKGSFYFYVRVDHNVI